MGKRHNRLPIRMLNKINNKMQIEMLPIKLYAGRDSSKANKTRLIKFFSSKEATNLLCVVTYI